MEEHTGSKKRLKSEPSEVKQAKTAQKEEKIRDEADEISDELQENSRRVHEIILRAVIRIALTLIIFGGMFYYFMSLQTHETQEERVKRNMQAMKEDYAREAAMHQGLPKRNVPF